MRAKNEIKIKTNKTLKQAGKRDKTRKKTLKLTGGSNKIKICFYA